MRARLSLQLRAAVVRRVLDQQQLAELPGLALHAADAGAGARVVLVDADLARRRRVQHQEVDQVREAAVGRAAAARPGDGAPVVARDREVDHLEPLDPLGDRGSVDRVDELAVVRGARGEGRVADRRDLVAVPRRRPVPRSGHAVEPAPEDLADAVARHLRGEPRRLAVLSVDVERAVDEVLLLGEVDAPAFLGAAGGPPACRCSRSRHGWSRRTSRRTRTRRAGEEAAEKHGGSQSGVRASADCSCAAASDVSCREGSAACAPGRVQAIDPAAVASASAASTASPRSSAATNAPAKASPAPTVSRASTSSAGSR